MYKKTLRIDYTTILQIELMINKTILEHGFDDFIEAELDYDDDGIYYGE